MKILVTNDDGVDNPGIWALVRAVKALGDVTVVAPAINQSGSGTGLSYRKPVKIREYESQVPGVPCYAVEGTPADSAILGIKRVMNEDVDVVVSGINPGNNTSRNFFVSGTLGAAIIASTTGVKSAAFSVELIEDVDDPVVSKITTAVTRQLIDGDASRASLFNINFPSIQGASILGAEECGPAPSLLDWKHIENVDGSFEVLSRLAISWDGSELPEGTDVEVLSRGRVALTAMDGVNLVHIPDDPTLQRMIASANRAIG